MCNEQWFWNDGSKIMNEQIEKLAVQSLVNHGGELIFSKEKFAELIVKECANELLKWRYEPFPLDAESAATIIKQHFGVK